MLASGRRVVVTGGLGSIGTVAAHGLVTAGARVVVNDVLPASAAAALLSHPAIGYIEADGATEAGARRLMEEAEATIGLPSDVVLLAGIVRPGGLLEQSPEDIAEVLRVNVVAATVTAQAAVRRWTALGTGGNLIFVSSWTQDVAWPTIAPYSASKAAMRSIARSFAREFAAQGIRSNVLAPGIVGVGMARRQWEEDADYRERARRAVPLGSLQSPESVADALVFLCSPLSSYMTGASLLVDGGASLYPLDPHEVARDDGE